MLNSRLIPEGGLISKSFLFWLKSQFSKKGIMSIFSIVFWQLFFGDLSQSQKLSEIEQGHLIIDSIPKQHLRKDMQHSVA